MSIAMFLLANSMNGLGDAGWRIKDRESLGELYSFEPIIGVSWVDGDKL